MRQTAALREILVDYKTDPEPLSSLSEFELSDLLTEKESTNETVWKTYVDKKPSKDSLSTVIDLCKDPNYKNQACFLYLKEGIPEIRDYSFVVAKGSGEINSFASRKIIEICQEMSELGTEEKKALFNNYRYAVDETAKIESVGRILHEMEIVKRERKEGEDKWDIDGDLIYILTHLKRLIKTSEKRDEICERIAQLACEFIGESKKLEKLQIYLSRNTEEDFGIKQKITELEMRN